MKLRVHALVCALLASCAAAPSAEPSGAVAWAPVPGRLATRWARDVDPKHPRGEYPRPTMVRQRWQSLNGLWEYAITAQGEPAPAKFEGSILVPFPIESSLSGVGRPLHANECLWYRREFEVPSSWASQRVLLNFGAVDWHAEVFLNGIELGHHTGGYDGFECELTSALRAGSNELIVAVTDPTDAGPQPRGKQVASPEGIWYTPTSGIWQTVWIEPVPRAALRALHVTADSSGTLNVRAETDGQGACGIDVEVLERGGRIANAAGASFEHTLHLRGIEPWTPGSPKLYGLRVRLVNGERETLDEVASYFAFRDVRIGAAADGVQRILLNGEPLFQFGPLDQGFWPDGLYTAPTLEALRFDIEAVKGMGGNMLRKHVKVEPEVFYAECDRAGVLVWQDMPSAFTGGASDPEQFERELRELIRERGNHPSIVMWVPFNEGWGQHETERITALVKELDPTRLVNDASGWTDVGVGDVIDVHFYPGPGMAPAEAKRASVLGEFGGLGLPLEGHTWLDKGSWGYRSFATQEELTNAYLDLLARLPLLIGQGLSAAVYTQTSDVEIEVNGWLSYDREVWKIDPRRAAAAARKLYEPPPRVRDVVAHAGNGGAAEWSYTFDAPAEGWQRPDFDASSWTRGKSGFGTRGTPGAEIGTVWSSPEIWLRREIELDPNSISAPHLWIHHDEDAQVFLNGVLALDLRGYTTSYVLEPLLAEARAALRAGANVLAIHCKQTGGGQYIDAGLADVGK